MNPVYQKLTTCYKSLRALTNFQPKFALVLGTGLGAFADRIRIVQTVSYHAIEGFPTSTVEGHKGQYVFGYVGAVPVVIMQGRVHYYEGYEIADVVLPIRLMKLMGAEILMVTNASGGVTAKMISPQSLSVATAATNMVGQEGNLFRFTIGHSIAMTLFICVLTYLQATVWQWMLP